MGDSNWIVASSVSAVSLSTHALEKVSFWDMDPGCPSFMALGHNLTLAKSEATCPERVASTPESKTCLLVTGLSRGGEGQHYDREAEGKT